MLLVVGWKNDEWNYNSHTTNKIDFHTKTLDELEKIKDKFSNEFSGMIADEKTVQVVDEYKCTYFPRSLGK